MRTRLLPIFILPILFCCIETCFARQTALSAPMDTLGPGMIQQQTFIDTVNFRTGNAHFSYSDKQPENVFFIQQESSLRSSTIADYHPWADGGFRISAGLFYSDEIRLKESANINLHTVIPYSDETEQLSVAPYFGVGWGVVPASQSNWAFTFDVGLIYQGQTAAFSTQQCRQNPFSAQCAKRSSNLLDMQELQYSIERYGLYPVLSAGVTFKF